MSVSNIYEAKTHLSQLIDLAMKGEEIVIARHGTPMVRLVPCEATHRSREPGILRGKIEIAEDFDALSADVLKGFYGEIEP